MACHHVCSATVENGLPGWWLVLCARCINKRLPVGTGTLACWNHPFEVARIEAQARGDQNQKDLNMVQIFRMIVKEQACMPLDPTCPALMHSR